MSFKCFEQSCEKCKKIYLKPAEGTEYAIEIETYETKRERMLEKMMLLLD